MTTARLPAAVLARAGLSAAEVADWSAPAAGPAGLLPGRGGGAALLRRGQAARPAPARAGRLHRRRAGRAGGDRRGHERCPPAFPARAYGNSLRRASTARPHQATRLGELVAQAATLVLAWCPPRRDGRRTRAGATGQGRHRVCPRPADLARPRAARLSDLDRRDAPAHRRGVRAPRELRDTGTADLGPVRVTRRGRAGVLELSNPRHLNAGRRDDARRDRVRHRLILLDPAIEVGVLRGGVTQHPRYRGRRVRAGRINLTHLYHGRIDFLLLPAAGPATSTRSTAASLPPRRTWAPWRTAPAATYGTEKLWVAAVECFAIRRGLPAPARRRPCDRHPRIAPVPARPQGGDHPGASNLRLPRFVGDRAARQAILSGREWTAGDPDAWRLLCDRGGCGTRGDGPGDRDAGRGRPTDLPGSPTRRRQPARSPAGLLSPGAAPTSSAKYNGDVRSRSGELSPSEPAFLVR